MKAILTKLLGKISSCNSNVRENSVIQSEEKGLAPLLLYVQVTSLTFGMGAIHQNHEIIGFKLFI